MSTPEAEGPGVRVESRPLTAGERAALIAEIQAPPSRGEQAVGWMIATLVLPAVGAMAATNIAAAQDLPARPAALLGAAIVLVAAVIGRRRMQGEEQRVQAAEGEARGRRLDASAIELWNVTPTRAWEVTCPTTRALLLELPDGRMLFVASHLLADVPMDAFPERLEIEALPALDRVRSLTLGGRSRGVEPGSISLAELGADTPMRRRRFVEIAPDALPAATRERMGLASPSGAVEVELPPPRLHRKLDIDDIIRVERALVPPSVRVRAILWTWSAPVLAVGLLASLRAWPAEEGVAPAFVAAFLVLWGVGAIRADTLRERAASRVFALGPPGAPPAWRRAGALVLRRGRVRGAGAVVSPLSGRPGVLVRVHLDFSGFVRGEDFEIEDDAGRVTRVDVEHAWLVHAPAAEQVTRCDAATHRLLQRLAGDPIPPPARRWYFPAEQVVAPGDVVWVLGLEDGTLHGTPPWPLLVWTDAMHPPSGRGI